METIFTKLKQDHEVQRELLKRIEDTSGDEPTRRELMEILKIELKEHAKFEERYFYQELMKEDLTYKKARHSISEHEDIDDKLDDLMDKDYSNTGWLTQFKTLKECVEHHLNEEEQEVFQAAGQAMDRQTKNESGRKYRYGIQEDVAANF